LFIKSTCKKFAKKSGKEGKGFAKIKARYVLFSVEIFSEEFEIQNGYLGSPL
jgi:hypothetical protein